MKNYFFTALVLLYALHKYYSALHNARLPLHTIASIEPGVVLNPSQTKSIEEIIDEELKKFKEKYGAMHEKK